MVGLVSLDLSKPIKVDLQDIKRGGWTLPFRPFTFTAKRSLDLLVGGTRAVDFGFWDRSRGLKWFPWEVCSEEGV